MIYDTKLLMFDEKSATEAARLLKNGEVVAIPTETVYGLAANALDEGAVNKIFAAKGRPQDNPLIVHISDISMLAPLAAEIPEIAGRLAERFWGGPLTMIFPKSSAVPNVTSGGLDTIAVRMPANNAAREIIRKCGFPLAAPSANISGRPSPTSARHVFEDMSGRIPLIIDGGECEVGVESTVICFEGDKIRILRPGAVTAELLSQLAPVEVDRAVSSELKKGDIAASPGMKYKHYSPRADVFIVNARGDAFVRYCQKRAKAERGIIALCAGAPEAGAPKASACENEIFLDYGENADEQARRLFSLLRGADELGAKTVLVEMPERSGVGLAVYNRLLRAAAFRIIEPDFE